MPSKEQWAAHKRRVALGLALCCKCRQDKPHSDFMPCPSRRPFGLSSHCKDCDLVRKRKLSLKTYQQLDAEGRYKLNKKSALMTNFKLSMDQYYAMLKSQSNVCAICGRPETSVHKGTGKVKSLAVDHDHKTGLVRGLLCAKCNTGLGYFNDDKRNLLSSALYLTYGPPVRQYTLLNIGLFLAIVRLSVWLLDLIRVPDGVEVVLDPQPESQCSPLN